MYKILMKYGSSVLFCTLLFLHVIRDSYIIYKVASLDDNILTKIGFHIDRKLEIIQLVKVVPKAQVKSVEIPTQVHTHYTPLKLY
jgi:hypothetical protein